MPEKYPNPPPPALPEHYIPLVGSNEAYVEIKGVLATLVEACDRVIEGRRDLAALEASERNTELMQHLRTQAREIVTQYETAWRTAIADAKEYTK